ncbi:MULTISPECIES: methyl-accepting chemotaxis protein [Acetobacterium]|jgi:methyl-accepting chemotaxis protein|uniref:Methyl-accepting chemotaxis protein II n=3 Tax=Acetobacterium wieringae TaxID=52694 RepID=A0A1F2PF58_9FIRM|nr:MULTISPECIES: methyl-accepting chemotaxis protein [Acetobacterium]OFV69695.1 methyl-accepting chemotaxis protein II [Acetobacterium wieringae]
MNNQRTQTKKTDSIRFKLLIMPLFCVFLGIFAIGLISSYLIRNSLLDQLKDHGYTTSQRFVTQLENNANAIEALTEATAGATSQESKEIKDEFSYQAQIDKMANDENIVYIAIIDKNVIDIADSIAEDIGNDYSDDETMKAAAQEGIASASEYYYELKDVTVYDVLYPLTINGELVGAIDIGYSMENVYAAVTNNILLIAGVGLLIFVILALILYRISLSITKPITNVNQMIQEMNQGYLGTRLNMKESNEIGEMAVALDNFADNLQFVLIKTLNQIAAGDLSAEIQSQGDRDEITPALKQTIENIRHLIAEANFLSAAAIEGRLETRGNAENFQGGFKEIVQGVNETLNAVILPLNVAADYIQRIGHGEIPPQITDTYHGDFNTIKNNINSCIDGLGALEDGNRVLARMSVNDFSQTIDESCCGIFSEISHSINRINNKMIHIMDIVNRIANGDMSDLADLKSTGKRSDNDQLIPSLIGMIENIVLLVDETQSMTQIAVEGDLDHRGDASKFPGEYARVIEGFNNTLDAVIDPIRAASTTLNQLAQGNLKVTMAGDFKGQHGKIKDDMNRTIDFLKQYVDEITATLEKIGQGDLTQEITNHYLGDFIAIKYAINDITSHLSTVMREIIEAADQVDSGSRQISDGGQQLSHGTTEQASSIEELSSSIEEVAAETKQNAVNANEANDRAIEVRSNAQIGNEQIQKMVTSMSDINASSHNISKVIKVIDDIAFQTNILALNAAVEAARAGQHGKGFAVVAEEVRTLAARSAEAAKETTFLIEGSISKVEAGTKIADETAEGLKEILNQIEKVSDLVANIARASNDQASEIAQITMGLDQVSQVVQANSATAEESAAASQELSSQAEMLKEMMEAFKLKQLSTTPINTDSRLGSSYPAFEKTEFESMEPIIDLDDRETDNY